MSTLHKASPWANGAFLTLLVAGVMAICQTRSSAAWRVTSLSGNSVDENGVFTICLAVGTLDLGSGEAIPVVMTFCPKDSISNPVLGSGWKIPLLDSYILQRNEKRFTIYQPDGSVREMVRSPSDAAVLTEPGGWKARIDRDGVTVLTEDGWKLSYKTGKLQSFETPLGRKCQIKRVAAKRIFIELQGRAVLSLESSEDGNVYKLSLPEGEASGRLHSRPIVETTLKQPLVSRLEPAVSELTTTEGAKISMEYGVTERMEPTLNLIRDSRTGCHGLYVWDARTGKLKSHEGRGFEAVQKPNGELGLLVTDEHGRKQGFMVNPTTSTYEEFDGEGGGVKYYSFGGAGKLNGMPRKTEVLRDGKSLIVSQTKINEKGNIVEEKRLVSGAEEVTQYGYDEKGLLASRVCRRAETVLWEEQYSKGVLQSKQLPGLTVNYAPGAVTFTREEKPHHKERK